MIFFMPDHIVDIVNEKDEVIGQAMKSEKAEKGFISRVAAVILADSRGKIILAKRSEKKKYSPGLWDLAAVGSVMAGETYEASARRELKEELGIECELKLLNKFYQEAENLGGGQKLKYFCGVFLGKTDAVPVLNNELSEMRKISLQELEGETKNNPEKFCQGFLNDFGQVREKLKKELFYEW
jgi:isopentenyldiphosphate isomerase